MSNFAGKAGVDHTYKVVPASKNLKDAIRKTSDKTKIIRFRKQDPAQGQNRTMGIFREIRTMKIFREILKTFTIINCP